MSSTFTRYPLVRYSYARATRPGVFSSPSRCGSSPSATSSCAIRSCIRALYLALCIGLSLPAGVAAGAIREDAAQATEDPDALYRDRERPASAQAAEREWASRLAADRRDFESAWKLSRIRYWLGTKGPGTDEQKKA